MARGLVILRHAVLPAYPPIIACAPASAPAPAPVPASGDQEWPAASNKANQRLTVLALAIASVLAIVFLLLIYYVVLLRHRSSLRRRRRRRLIRSLTGTDPPDGDNDAVNHHAWHIRTVGLNQEAIEAIPVVEFGEEWKGAVDDCDCAVCLSEFDRGELLRLLPKCGHAFHVQCIDTWLQSHVNCPLCRAPVVPPLVTPAPGDDGRASPQSSEAGGAYAAAPEATGDLEEAASQIGHRPTSPSAVKVSSGGTESLSGTGESSAHGSSRDNAPEPQLSDLEGYDSEGSQLPNDGHQSSPCTLSYLRASVPVHRSISIDSTLSATSLPAVELCGSSDSKELDLGNQMPVSSEEKQENDPKGMSDDKNPTEMARSLSTGGGNFLLSRFGRGRSSSVLPL